MGGLLAPNQAGFSHFDGGLIGALEPAPRGYYNWPHVINGQHEIENEYNTSVIVDAASQWIQQAPEPWFCYLAFYAPHSPLHVPPAGLYTEDLTGLDPATTPRPFYKAMIEAMDTEMGRLFQEMGPILDRTDVIFLGDNGTPANHTLPPFDPLHAKGTVYGGGIQVPLIVAGPSVSAQGSQSQALINTTDLYATVAELAGLDAQALLPQVPLDSVSIVPYLSNPDLTSLRSFQYAELFSPVGATGLSASTAARTISNGQFKLIFRSTRSSELGRALQAPQLEFYDLLGDPFESQDLLLGPLNAEQQAALDDLRQGLIGLLRSERVRESQSQPQPYAGP